MRLSRLVLRSVAHLFRWSRASRYLSRLHVRLPPLRRSSRYCDRKDELVVLHRLTTAGDVDHCGDRLIGDCRSSSGPEWLVTLAPDGLEDRLIAFGPAICADLRRMPKDLVGTHVSRQLVRSATSPPANYAEARGAESRRDFIHKMQICLKELREMSVWLQFAHRLCGRQAATAPLAQERHELIAVFVKSINTARASSTRR